MSKRNLAINEYIEKEDHIEIICILGEKRDIVYIDKDDLDKVKNYKWRIHSKKGYPVATHIKYENGRRIATTVNLHNIIKGNHYDKGMLVDHIDRNKLNARKDNLRIVSTLENCLNKSKSSRNTSGRTGVRLKRTSRGEESWVGTCEINGIKKSKSFSTKKYGYDKAYELALKFREESEIKYNIRTEK